LWNYKLSIEGLYWSIFYYSNFVLRSYDETVDELL